MTKLTTFLLGGGRHETDWGSFECYDEEAGGEPQLSIVRVSQAERNATMKAESGGGGGGRGAARGMGTKSATKESRHSSRDGLEHSEEVAAGSSNEPSRSVVSRLARLAATVADMEERVTSKVTELEARLKRLEEKTGGSG